MDGSPITQAEQLAIRARIFDVSSDALIVVDSTGIVVSVNMHAEFMFGRGAMEIEGKPVNNLLPEDRREAHTGHLKGYIPNPKPRAMGESMDLKARRLDNGDEFSVLVELSPFSTATRVYTLATVRRIG